MTSRQHTVTAVILVLTGIYLMHLSTYEIQPWDEGLYAVRAKSIVEFNAWWDQTNHALGGLYSSTAPPFVPWLVAVSISILGPSAIAVRIPIVLCSAIALWMMYLIARRMVTYEHSILTVCVLAGSLHWLIFAKQAMTEVPLMMWCLIALWASLRWHESELLYASQPNIKNHRWMGVAVYGAAFGMALMTKMLVSFVPLVFLAPHIIGKWKSHRFLLEAGVALAIAAAIAGPWYAMMWSAHHEAFLQGVPFAHLVASVEGNSQALGPIFYVNQLIIGQAILVLSMLYVAVSMIKREYLPSRNQYAAMSVLGWFVTALLVFSIAVTKNIHYTVMLLPPAVLLAVYAAERFLLLANRRFVVVSYGVVAAFTIWAMLPVQHRQYFRTSPFDSTVLLEGLVIVFVACVGLFLPRKYLQTLAVQLFKPVLYGAAALFLIRGVGNTLTNGAVGGTSQPLRGGRAVAGVLIESTSRSFTYLYHKRSDGDSLNPQLAWYLNGWMSGWTRGRSYHPVALPEDRVSDSAAVLGVEARSVYIVYLHAARPHTERLLQNVQSALAPSYSAREFDDYTLFIRR